MGACARSVSATRGSRQSIAKPIAGRLPISKVATQPRALLGRTLLLMRIVLEWLGLVGPDPVREEPVAVPVWAPYAVAAIIAIAATAPGVALRVLIDAMV